MITTVLQINNLKKFYYMYVYKNDMPVPTSPPYLHLRG